MDDELEAAYWYWKQDQDERKTWGGSSTRIGWVCNGA